MKLSLDLINASPQFTNTLKQRELDLRNNGLRVSLTRLAVSATFVYPSCVAVRVLVLIQLTAFV